MASLITLPDQRSGGKDLGSRALVRRALAAVPGLIRMTSNPDPPQRSGHHLSTWDRSRWDPPGACAGLRVSTSSSTSSSSWQAAGSGDTIGGRATWGPSRASKCPRESGGHYLRLATRTAVCTRSCLGAGSGPWVAPGPATPLKARDTGSVVRGAERRSVASVWVPGDHHGDRLQR